RSSSPPACASSWSSSTPCSKTILTGIPVSPINLLTKDTVAHVSSLRAPQPRQRFLPLRIRKVPEVGLDEVRGDLRRDGEKAAVTQHGDSLDFLVVLPDEAQMSDQGREVLPAGKRRGVEHQPVEFAVGFDPEINLFRHLLKIGHFQPPFGSQNQDPLRFQ